ncbi:MAG: sensor histidine kinase [bacterium]
MKHDDKAAMGKKIFIRRLSHFFADLLLNIWKKFLNVSIRIKLMGLAVLTTIFLAFIIMYFMLSFYKGEISHDAQFMSRVIGRHISEAAGNFILNKNYNKLNILLKNEVKHNKDILYIFYRNNNGIIAASALQNGFYSNIVNNILTANNHRGRLSTAIFNNHVYGKILDTSFPVSNGKFGVIRVGISLNSMKDSFFAQESPLFFKNVILILICTFIFIYLIFKIIAWWFLTPIIKLWDATEKIKASDYNIHIATMANDEIGKLSKSFSEMALILKEAEMERIKNEDLRKDFIKKIINAQEEERKKISRSLHDRLGQFLSSLKIKLRMLDDCADAGEVKIKINQIRDDLTEGFNLIHDMAKNLRPSILDEVGLVNAVNQHISDVVKNNPDIKIDFYPINFEDCELDKNLEVNIYRIVQEAVLNVIRHACATSITIILERYEGKIRGIIEDNGAGFGCCGEDYEHLGIDGMKERAKLFDGELTVESEKNLGTIVKFNIPYT